jgi:UTP--glucose-1-phosphate uridylyltransferase
MIRKVIIPAAGLGTRLFPTTKEQPKEMLPIFCRLTNGDVGLKPLLQLVFEQLYGVGIREFCFVVGRGKRCIEDHFTPDPSCIVMLEKQGKADQALDLERFYQKIKTSTIIWVNQPEPKGFGDSVLIGEPFVQNENCIVHAGDTYILSEQADHLIQLIRAYDKFQVDAAFIVREVADARQYGVIEGDKVEGGIYRVKAAVEKPNNPPSNLAITAIYCFDPVVFKALERTEPGKKMEIQLTDAIQKLIDWELEVYAVRLNHEDSWLDIGSPETYRNALSASYKYARTSKQSEVMPQILQEV